MNCLKKWKLENWNKFLGNVFQLIFIGKPLDLLATNLAFASLFCFGFFETGSCHVVQTVLNPLSGWPQTCGNPPGSAFQVLGLWHAQLQWNQAGFIFFLQYFRHYLQDKVTQTCANMVFKTSVTEKTVFICSTNIWLSFSESLNYS